MSRAWCQNCDRVTDGSVSSGVYILFSGVACDYCDPPGDSRTPTIDLEVEVRSGSRISDYTWRGLVYQEPAKTGKLIVKSTRNIKSVLESMTPGDEWQQYAGGGSPQVKLWGSYRSAALDAWLVSDKAGGMWEYNTDDPVWVRLPP